MYYSKGFICGAWDLLHAGHVLALEECHKHCGRLIVGLHVDPSVERPEKNKPIQSVYERITQLKACKFVDGIIVYETEAELETILYTNDFNVRFLGADYDENKPITAKDAVQIEKIGRHHNYSSTQLRERITNGK